ncbi:MAG: glucose 1-dehydrogenase [Cyclobacteriaceae bacterium]
MENIFSLEGKTAVITGGASGIGKSISSLFAERGAVITLIDVNDEAGKETLAEISGKGGAATYHSCDITKQQNVQDVFESIYSNTGSIDILVNNAGLAFVGTIEQTTEEDLDRLYEVNIKGAYNCALAAIQRMKRGKGGAILNLASAASLVGLQDRFAYSMTKGAILTMTYSIAKDYVAQGIRCNSIAPGRVHTPLVDGYLAKNYPGKEKEMFEKLSKTQPIGRMGKPIEMAYLALYLCSNEASFVTGSNYSIDGGFVTLNT